MDDDHTPRLQLPYLAAAQAQKHVTLNEALGRLDGLVACRVKSRGVSAPPAAPAEGDAYVAPATALSGDWSPAVAGDLIRWVDGAWSIAPAPAGLLALVEDEACVCVRDTDGWRRLGERLGRAQALDQLGVGTAADATNPLSAKLNSLLFTAKAANEGGDGDLRVTLNKEAAANVLSLLFQTGYGARAEIGLIGDDDLTLKVSSDGVAWITALKANRATGAISLPALPLGVGEGGTGARDAAAACETLNALSLGGGVMTGPVVTAANAGLVCQATNAVFPPASMIINESSHSISNRAAMLIGSKWVLGQDFLGSGVRDLFIYNENLGAAQLQLPAGGGLLVHGTSAFDAAGVLMLKPSLAANLPSAMPAGRLIWCSDAGAALVSNGAGWWRLSGGLTLISADADRAVGAFDAPVQVQTGVLTVMRHVGLPTPAATGATFRFVRSDAGAGALDIGGLKTLTPQSWCEVAFDGSAWRLIGGGAL